MLLLFNPRKSHRHPALRDQALACVVYDDWQILVAKLQIIFEKWTQFKKKMNKNCYKG
jgi:hypothetical protein